jgi:hypothetical protein
MLESPAELLGELESSGLLSPSIVEHRDALLKTASAEQAAQELVRLQLLTEFQAEVTLKTGANTVSHWRLHRREDARTRRNGLRLESPTSANETAGRHQISAQIADRI